MDVGRNIQVRFIYCVYVCMFVRVMWGRNVQVQNDDDEMCMCVSDVLMFILHALAFHLP